jgi:hypothetical protein
VPRKRVSTADVVLEFFSSASMEQASMMLELVAGVMRRRVANGEGQSQLQQDRERLRKSRTKRGSTIQPVLAVAADEGGGGVAEMER